MTPQNKKKNRASGRSARSGAMIIVTTPSGRGPRPLPLSSNQRLKAFLVGEVSDAKDKLAQFATKFKERPFDAMRWSGSAFHAAARVEVATSLLAVLDNNHDASAKDLHLSASREALRLAAHPTMSTSMPTSYLAICELEVWATMADVLGQWSPE